MGLKDIVAEFVVDIERAKSRVTILNGMIPQLEKEREQLIGMIAVMEKVLAGNEEQGDGTNESESNGSKPNSIEKRRNGKNRNDIRDKKD